MAPRRTLALLFLLSLAACRQTPDTGTAPPAPSAAKAAAAGSEASLVGRADFRGDKATILGLRLGQTWDEARKIVQANHELAIHEDPGNPGRFYVDDQAGPASGDRALFYCQWPDGTPGMGRLVIYPRVARFLPAGDAQLFGAASVATLPPDVKSWLGPEDRSVVSLDIPSIGLKLTDHVYEKRALEISDSTSSNRAPHVNVVFMRPDLLTREK